MLFRGDPASRRRACPGCGGIEQRSLRLCGQDRRHFQCMACGRRHVVRSPLLPAPDRSGAADGLSAQDREIVEALILLMTGSGLRVGAVEATARAFHELREQHGPPSATLRGFEFPVFTWLVEQAPAHTVHFVAIDQGERRICFRVRRRRQHGPL